MPFTPVLAVSRHPGAFVVMLSLLVRGLWKARAHAELGTESRALLASLIALIACGTTGGYAFNWFFYMVLGLAGAVVAHARISAVKERVDARVLAVA